jgi:hypothetical protein
MYPEEYAALAGKMIENPYEEGYIFECNVASSLTCFAAG